MEGVGAGDWGERGWGGAPVGELGVTIEEAVGKATVVRSGH